MTQALRLDRLEKNYLINGACDLFQRGGVGAAVNLSATPAYAAPDRFRVSMSNAAHFTGTPTVQRIETAPANGLTRYCMQFSGNAASASGTYLATQRIESVFARELAGLAASFGVWAYSESATTVQLTIRVADAFDNFATSTQVYQATKTISAANAWTLAAFENVSIPDTAGRGLEVEFQIMTMSVTGSVKLHRFTQFMMNAGSKLASFALAGRNQLEDELLAFRYFHTDSYDTGTIYGATAGSDSGIQFPIYFKVPMRAAPTVARTGVTFQGWTVSGSPVGVDDGLLLITNTKMVQRTRCTTSGTWNSRVAATYTADAEL